MAKVKIINPYYSKNNKSHLRTKKKSFLEHLFVNKIYSLLGDITSQYYASLHSSMPLAIEVETLNRCNNNCSFCPVNRDNDPRDYCKMSDDLLEKIASELELSKYNGLIALFSNNEPLLDDRIVDICNLFRKKVKKAYIHILTNGLRLNFELYMRLFDAGLDELLIDNYNDELKLIAPVESLLNEINSINNPILNKYASKTKIILRKKTEILTNRAGFAPNKTKENFDSYKYFSNHLCTLPFIQLVIRSSGGVSMCCQDALGRVTLGDINNESLSDIWNGSKYNSIRMRLKKYGRKSLSLCSGCDVSILHTTSLKRKIYEIFPIRGNSFRL